MNKVGIITANYNNSQFLDQYVKGLLGQVIKPDHIAFVDDCSTDDSVEKIEYLKQQYKNELNITINSMEKNSGPAAARNRAIDILLENKCDILCVCDSDDFYYERKISESLLVMEKFGQVALVYSDYDMIYTDKNTPSKREFKEPFNMSRLYDECIVSNNSIYKSEILETIGKYDESLYGPEDYDLWIRIAEVAPIYHIPKPLYAYRISGNNLTIQTPSDQFAEHVMRVKRKAHERRTVKK